MTTRRYICFTCYKFHSEMRGISLDEFNAGDNVCKEIKCERKGQPLEPADYCDICDSLFPIKEKHQH